MGRRMGSHVITVQGEVERDRYGDPVGAPAAVDIAGCFWQPGSTSERTSDARTTVVSQPAVFIPAVSAAASVTEGAKIAFAGEWFEVDGVPERHFDQRGRLRHVKALLRRVEGA